VEYKKEDSDFCVFIKGAPEKIWKFCINLLVDEKLEKITPELNTNFEKVNLQFGKQGERVLGFAKLHLSKEFTKGFQFNLTKPENFNFPIVNYTFVGLISLIDPPKLSVPYAVIKCKTAGIKVIMVTGDQPPTAAAIAKQVNIIPHGCKTVDDIMEEKGCSWEEAYEHADAIVIHGDRLNKSLE